MRKQCKSCPWKVSADPYAIPNGYSPLLHKGLANTIAPPGEVRLGCALRIMACHYSEPGKEIPCVGWLVNQLVRAAVLATLDHGAPREHLTRRTSARHGQRGKM